MVFMLLVMQIEGYHPCLATMLNIMLAFQWLGLKTLLYGGAVSGSYIYQELSRPIVRFDADVLVRSSLVDWL